jgi:hypothetical protein
MHSRRRKPADPATAHVLTTLRDNLLSLHKTLLDSERAAYERDVAKIDGPGPLLGLVMGDPWFAYLRDLSQFVVLIDEMLDSREEAATMSDAKVLVARARDLLKPVEDGTGFEKRYYEALQRDPGVVIAHSRVTKAIAGLQVG